MPLIERKANTIFFADYLLRWNGWLSRCLLVFILIFGPGFFSPNYFSLLFLSKWEGIVFGKYWINQYQVLYVYYLINKILISPVSHIKL